MRALTVKPARLRVDSVFRPADVNLQGGCMPQGNSKLVLLGTGTPNAEPTRSGPSVAVAVGDRPYLFDFGPGVVRQAAAAFEKGLRALAPPRLTRAFLTHLHSDHTIGYPDLILTPWTLGRREPLAVFGPPGLRAMTDGILSAYREDIRERLEGLEPANEAGCQVDVTEIEPGLVYRDEHIEIEAFAVHHGSWPAFGYRVTAPDRVFVISGDTAPFPDWERVYAGCDVLVHEVGSAVGLVERTAEWQAYHHAFHTTTEQLADVASIAKPRLLVLTHALTHGVSEEDLLAEVREGYNGSVLLGRDLDVF